MTTTEPSREAPAAQEHVYTHGLPPEMPPGPPLAIVIGEGEYPAKLAELFRENLTEECRVVTFATTGDAALVLGCTPDFKPDVAPPPIALLAIVVGDDTETANQMIEPIGGCPAFHETRLIVLCTSLQISGVDWLVDRGWLDWVGYAQGLEVDTFLQSMRSQISLFHEHQQVGSIPRTSSLFDQPLSDSQIIEKVMRRIERSLGQQPRITLPEGVHLATKGAWLEEVTIILKGSVALIHESPTGDIVMHEGSTGRIIGLLAVSEGHRASFNAVTTSEVVGVRLTVEQLNLAVQGHPDITLLLATLFIRSLERRLRRAEQLHIQNAELSDQVEAERAQLAAALVNLEDARTELSAQERLASLGTLSAGVAHELNNPMAAIQRISEYLGEDVASLLETAPNAKWSGAALTAMRSGIEAPAWSSREERKLRRKLTKITGDPAVAQRLALAGIRDPDFAKQLKRRSGITLEGAEQAASIGTQLRNLRSASQRITDLVSSLRSFARPDGDHIPGVDVHASIDDAIRLLSHKLANITVKRNYAKLPTLTGHPGQLSQVWTNILTNAAEAIMDEAERRPAESSKTGGSKAIGKIKVKTRSPRPGWIRVEITDDGPGIPEKILPHVFEPRFTTKSGQVRFGMGIGLGVTRSIVGKHHGTMRIRTGSDGTTVVVDLPTKAPEEEQ